MQLPNWVIRTLLTLAFVAFSLAGIASAQQQQQSPYPIQPVTFGVVPSRGIHPSSLAADGAAGLTLPNWTGTFTDGGTTYPYTMLGTDPSLGSATTALQTVIIPLKVVFSDGTILDATAPAFGHPRSPLQLTQQSPLFNNATFAPGGTNVGTTQYIDAFQRANFWNIVKASAPNYHVKFNLATMPVQTLVVPAYFGFTAPGPGSRLGYVNFAWWDGQLAVLLYRLKIKTNTAAIFLSYSIFQTSPGFTFAGYHTAFGSPAQVYMSSGFYDQGVFRYGGDIIVLSHEMGETLDDPFINNIVPLWSNPQSPGTCSNLLEVGDPVSGLGVGTVFLNGFTYHPEDLTFLPWFAGQTPSTSVNGWYSFGNHYSSPAVCNVRRP